MPVLAMHLIGKSVKDLNIASHNTLHGIIRTLLKYMPSVEPTVTHQKYYN